MPRQLRVLFSTILAYQNPVDPAALWAEFIEDMSEDFTRRHSVEAAAILAWEDIEDEMNRQSTSLNNCNIPRPAGEVPNITDEINVTVS